MGWAYLHVKTEGHWQAILHQSYPLLQLKKKELIASGLSKDKIAISQQLNYKPKN